MFLEEDGIGNTCKHLYLVTTLVPALTHVFSLRAVLIWHLVLSWRPPGLVLPGTLLDMTVLLLGKLAGYERTVMIQSALKWSGLILELTRLVQAFS